MMNGFRAGDLVIATPYLDLGRTTIIARQPGAYAWNIQVTAGEMLLVAAPPSTSDAVLKVLRNGQLIEVLRSNAMMPNWVTQ